MTEKELQARIDELLVHREQLDKHLTARLKRTVKIETKLLRAGYGKDPLPTQQDLLDWGLELGTPEEFTVDAQDKKRPC